MHWVQRGRAGAVSRVGLGHEMRQQATGATPWAEDGRVVNVPLYRLRPRGVSSMQRAPRGVSSMQRAK